MKRTGPRTEPWGILQVGSEGEDFTSFTLQLLIVSYLAGKNDKNRQRKIKEQQSKITDTESVFEVSQKNAVIDSVKGSV